MKTVSGTMIWVNLNSKKTRDWRKHVDAHSRVSEPFQTYLIHSQKINSKVEEERWWTQQSNVHGVVIAANVLAQDAISSSPKVLGTIVEHFVPDLKIAVTDFEEFAHTSNLNVLSFSGDDKRSFFSAVKIGLASLHGVFHQGINRKDAVYVGYSIGVTAAALEYCDEEATEIWTHIYIYIHIYIHT